MHCTCLLLTQSGHVLGSWVVPPFCTSRYLLIAIICLRGAQRTGLGIPMTSNSALAWQCPICQHPPSLPFLKLERVPVFCNVLHPSDSAARRAPCSAIHLVVCDHCALIYNAQFEPALVQYSSGYNNPLDVSECFRSFAKQLSAKLIKNHGLFGGTAIEIGCGNGFFLEQLVESGMHEGIGYDPAARGRVEKKNSAVQVLPELFNLDRSVGAVDAIICRHVFEHLPKSLRVSH